MSLLEKVQGGSSITQAGIDNSERSRRHVWATTLGKFPNHRQGGFLLAVPAECVSQVGQNPSGVADGLGRLGQFRDTVSVPASTYVGLAKQALG